MLSAAKASWATSCRLDASTSSSGKSPDAILVSTPRMSASSGAGSASAGKAPIASPMPTSVLAVKPNCACSARPAGTSAYMSPRGLPTMSPRMSAAAKSGEEKPGMRIASAATPTGRLDGIDSVAGVTGPGATGSWFGTGRRGTAAKAVRTRPIACAGSTSPATTRIALLGAYQRS